MSKKLIPGVQLYSVRDDLAKDFEGTIKAVAEMGYKNVELAGYYGGKTGEEIKAILDKYGLVSVSVHQGIDMFLNEGQKAVDFFKAYGVKYVTVPWYPLDNIKTEEGRKATVENFTKVAKLLKENGMTLQYHNHDFEFNKLDDGRYYLDWLYESISADLLKPQLDLCWVKYGGEEPVKYLEKYADRISTVHYKDFYSNKFAAGAVYDLIGTDDQPEQKSDVKFKFMPLGMGIQDMDAIIAATKETNAEYVIVEQDSSEDRPPMEAIKISMDFLKSKGIY